MFETYEERFPFESDFLNGEEPKAQVERLLPEQDASCRFHTTPAGLKRFAQMAETFELEELYVNLTGHSGSLHLDALSRPEDIKSLTVLQSVKLGAPPTKADISGLESYNKLERLHLGLVRMKPTWFAKDLTLREVGGDHESIAGLLKDHFWQDLRRLDITHLKSDFTDMPPSRRLSWLRVRGAKLASLDEVAQRCPMLDTLILELGRSPLDIRALQHLSGLKILKLIGPRELIGLEDLRLAELKECYLSSAKSCEFFDQNPGISWFRTKSFEGEPSKGMLARGWKRLGKEAGTGDGFIPEALRN